MEIDTGSFVHMVENITATHVMFHSAPKSLLGKIKKLQDKNITKLQVVIIILMANVSFDGNKEENEEERHGKQQCGNVST